MVIPRTEATIAQPTPSSSRMTGWYNMAVGKNGIIYITWMECDGNNCSAKMKRSFDGGSTWDNERIIDCNV